MAERPTWRPYDAIAQRWSDLAERRRAHFIDLYRTGRWKHYYTEKEFVAQMRDVIDDANKWAKLAGATQVMRQAAE